MMTNTFAPFVGGVSRSVTSFTTELRRMGHRVVIVAPVFENMPESEEDVVRVPALQHFTGSDFAVVLPIPGYLLAKLEKVKPDVIHTHHPHLLGEAAVRVAGAFECPLVFTYHTMYERYLHYVPSHAKRLREFVINLVTRYCNLCDHLIAPSESVAQVIRSRDITTPFDVVPTGVYPERFAHGDGAAFRASHDIPSDAFVAGYVGRLAPEKNLTFLADAVQTFISKTEGGHFLVVGKGPSQSDIRDLFATDELTGRLHLAGSLEGQALTDAYHAMDVFVFASQSETQGMVVIEAMAAGKPVVAVDATGIREVVKDGRNGRLLKSEDRDAFAAALREMAQASDERMADYRRAARATAQEFSMQKSAQKLARIYDEVVQREPPSSRDESLLHRAIEEVKAEWELLRNIAEAASQTFR
ncbi:MAG: glycosyltransferase [Sedimentisphaerales bacterium]|nr:glycosyltransferase [Sedimentisphaerales bacterium]